MEYGYSVYETAGATPGRIVFNANTTESINVGGAIMPEGTELHPVFFESATYYIDVVTLEGMPRPVVFGKGYFLNLDQGLVVPNIPVGTVINYNGDSFITDGTDFEFSSSIPGTFRFEATPPWPHMQQSFGVTVS